MILSDKKKIAATGSLALLLFVTCPSLAAPPSPGETLFREGRTAMQERDYERACTKFAESQKVEPAPGTALNLGECEEQRGHLIAAHDAFSVAASSFTSPEKQKYAASRADAVDRRTPRITVRTSAPAPGLVVRIGTATIAIDTETKHDPGDIVIHAEAPGRKPKDLPATLRESKNLDIDIGVLESIKEGPAAPPPATTTVTMTSPDKPPKMSLRTVGVVMAGVGAASMIVGGVTGVMALGRASTVEDHCDADLACDQEGVDAASSGHTLSLVSTITLALGGALVAGGAVLYFLNPKAPAHITPAASARGGGLVFGGSF